MLAGFAGRLLSEAFLEAHLTTPIAGDATAVRRELIRWRRTSTSLGPASSLRTMLSAGMSPIAVALGYAAPDSIDIGGDAATATLRTDAVPVAVAVVGWGAPLDPAWHLAAATAVRRSARWTILFNGTNVRVIDAGRPFARRYADFNLDHALDDPTAFEVFWQVVNRNALGAPHGSDGSLDTLVAASDSFAAGVCESLKTSVLAASDNVLNALLSGRRRQAVDPSTLPDAFEQALTIVYRVVFLLFAESRGLMPIWHPVYRDSYSTDALRAAAESLGRPRGLWDTLRAMARLAHAGCAAGDLRVTAFNGRLFAPARTPLAERRTLDEESAKRAVLALSTRRSAAGGRERISYRDLGIDQLGVVYQTLLDYQPIVEASPKPRRVALQPGSGVRKATATFYTPQPLADHLARQTLGPLVAGRTPEEILRLRIVDPAMGSGAFLIAACHALADAYERALIEAGACHASDLGGQERAAIRRAIAERCLYGVDLNPMAVQLARLSLWLTTLAAEKPLTFLDHRLQAGDSLLGVWLAALVRAPGPGNRRRRRSEDPQLFDTPDFNEAVRQALPVRFSFESAPDDTIDAVRAKERAFSALNSQASALSKWRRIADLWFAASISADRELTTPGVFWAIADLILGHGGTLPGRLCEAYIEKADGIARRHRPFHWELEFPEVFFDADGRRLPSAGFDAVISNPPWKVLRNDPSTGGRNASGRAAAIVRFTREAGIYSAQSGGHANCYQLFAERALSLCRSGGRLGLLLPSGFATDHGSAALRRRLLTGCDVDHIAGFENSLGVFPIHRSVRFVLVTASTGRPTESIACRFGLTAPSDLEAHALKGRDARAVTVSSGLLERLSGSQLTIPWFRGPADVAIAERAASLFPRLDDPRGWGARFGRELNATEDRSAFSGPRSGLPVVEGKMVRAFTVDLNAATLSIARGDARRLLSDRRYERARVAYRDVAGSTNKWTLIAAILPADCVSTHTLFCLRTSLPLRDQHLLCGLFNTFIVNHLVRLQVTTHVTTSVVEGLPIPIRKAAPTAGRTIAALARTLAKRHDARAFAHLQAATAALYQLTREEFEYVLSTFPLVDEEIRRDALRAFTAPYSLR